MPEPELQICAACQYPYAPPSCPNPACWANPDVREETKRGWEADRARRAAEQAERDMLARAREMSYRPRTVKETR